jgi:hypothetical protein
VGCGKSSAATASSPPHSRGFEDTDSDGSFDRRFLVRLTIQLVDDDTLTATGTIVDLTLDGTTLLAGPISGILSKATRMRVIRE